MRGPLVPMAHSDSTCRYHRTLARHGRMFCTSDRFTGNKHPFTYVQTRAGSSTLYVFETPGGIGSSHAAAAGRGLMATYYETPDFGNHRFAQDCITRDGTTVDNAYCNVGTINISCTKTLTPGCLTNGCRQPIKTVKHGLSVRPWDKKPTTTKESSYGLTTID